MRKISLNITAISMALAGLSACDQGSYGGHMMTGGPMSGGMMGQVAPISRDQMPPQQQTDGSKLFQQYCSQCHAPPAPMSHTATEWPPVVNRMRQHMVAKGATVPSNDQLHEITNFLQQHAG